MAQTFNTTVNIFKKVNGAVIPTTITVNDSKTVVIKTIKDILDTADEKFLNAQIVIRKA